MKNVYKQSIVIAIVAISIISSSCFREGLVGIRGSGPIVSQVVYLQDFTGIDLQISGDVVISKGNYQEVVIEAQQNIIDNIERRVSGDTWNIGFDRNVRSHDGVTIFITVPEIEELEISGSGDIASNDDFITNSLDMSISGSGDIDFRITADYVYSHISGSGDIYLNGSTEYHDIHISGSGTVDAYPMITENCEISIPGSGSAYVYVTDILDVSISGSGSVYYQGYPSVSYNISGSGNIYNDN